MSGRKAAPSNRRTVAKESFKSAADCIGPIVPGLALFAVTRGQFSMVDAVLHVLEQLGPSKVSLWTWTVADYEIQQFTSLQRDHRITEGRLVIDAGARGKNAPLIAEWCRTFGDGSVRYVMNHAKIATVEGGGRRVLLRGSMNLNFNPRFEQLDVTEGGPDFDLIREIEDELPILGHNASGREVYKASKVSAAFDSEQLAIFEGTKRWAK